MIIPHFWFLALLLVACTFHHAQSIQSSSPLRQNIKAFPPKPEEPRITYDLSALSSRKGFIRKVYSIFSAQMLCTIITTAVIMHHPKLARYLQRHFEYVFVSSFGVATSIALLLVSFPSLRYRPSRSLPLLFLHALSQSTMIGTIAR